MSMNNFLQIAALKDTHLAALQVEEKCQDNPYFANCKLIVKARCDSKSSPFFTWNDLLGWRHTGLFRDSATVVHNQLGIKIS